jgi:hypothetical protein
MFDAMTGVRVLLLSATAVWGCGDNTVQISVGACTERGSGKQPITATRVAAVVRKATDREMLADAQFRFLVRMVI